MLKATMVKAADQELPPEGRLRLTVQRELCVDKRVFASRRRFVKGHSQCFSPPAAYFGLGKGVGKLEHWDESVALLSARPVLALYQTPQAIMHKLGFRVEE